MIHTDFGKGFIRAEVIAYADYIACKGEHGVRWIVNYKTGTHKGGDMEEFLDREQERYRTRLRSGFTFSFPVSLPI